MIHLIFRHPDMPPTLNGKDGLLRMHWSKRKEVKTKFMWLIKMQNPEKITGLVKLVMTNYYIMPMDWDNLAGRLKIPGDCLVSMGKIEEDNPELIVDFDMKQKRVKKRSEVRLEFMFTEYEAQPDS